LSKAYWADLGTHYPAMAPVQIVRLVEKKTLLEIEATLVALQAGAGRLPMQKAVSHRYALSLKIYLHIYPGRAT
jgi:hypothetical protein